MRLFILSAAVSGATAPPASAQATQFYGPTPYRGLSDSPFHVGNCADFRLEDFESGSLAVPGVTASAGQVLPPSPSTDSVDVDVGGVDGTGIDGHSWWSGFPNGPRTMRFTFTEPLPTIAGLVWTDCYDPATDHVTFEAFDSANNLLGTIGPESLGDGVASGETDEDRFFGVRHSEGIKAIAVTMTDNGNFEIDHLQFGCATKFFGPRPYREFADSPFYPMVCPDFFLEDFESGSLVAPRVSASAGIVLSPSASTDSVDGDAGGIDDTGTDGHSWWSGFPNGPRTMKFTFKSKLVFGGGPPHLRRSLPTIAGLVWTDSHQPAFDGVTFEAFDAANVSLGKIGPISLGDHVASGETEEDRFFGVQHSGGIRSISITMATSGNFEVDHLQYGCWTQPRRGRWTATR